MKPRVRGFSRINADIYTKIPLKSAKISVNPRTKFLNLLTVGPVAPLFEGGGVYTQDLLAGGEKACEARALI
jgi:hypothetical protein